MSTIKNAVFNADSDEESDPDFIPDGQSDSSDEEAATTTAPGPETVAKGEERAAQKEVRASLWASFQSSITGTSGASSSSSTPAPKQIRLVKVEKKYRFAGEDVSEIVEVPEDSEDARKWPLWNPSRSSAASVTQALEAPASSTPPVRTAEAGPSSSSTAPTSARPRPGPRKPKTALTPLPSGKPKKLTTLEKSAMDWRAHIASAGTQGDSGADSLADELERNRRSGGYLEKVAFVERVGSRREELFDESRKKRRKG